VTTYGLTAGVNAYADPNCVLAGCVNDALDWGRLLASRGAHVTTLLDQNATREMFLDQLGEHVARLRYRDRLVVTWSGHGTRLPDADGDEADGWDEAIVMQDMGLVTDDDLSAIFEARRYGSRIVFVSDSCHAGTVNRAGSFNERAVATFDAKHPVKRRYLPPAYIPGTGQRVKAAKGLDLAAPRRILTASSSALLLAAAAPTEYAYDAWFTGPNGRPRPNGAFSRAAIDVLAATPAPPTYQQWMRSVALPSPEYPQTPQLDGSTYQARWAALD
jgi:hypothetical protein